MAKNKGYTICRKLDNLMGQASKCLEAAARNNQINHDYISRLINKSKPVIKEAEESLKILNPDDLYYRITEAKKEFLEQDLAVLAKHNQPDFLQAIEEHHKKREEEKRVFAKVCEQIGL